MARLVPIQPLTGKVRIGINLRSIVTRSHQEVASIIESFVEGTGRDWDWDDFCAHEIENRELDAIRLKCRELSFSHPPMAKGQYCDDEGIELLRETIRNLRSLPD